MDNPEHLLPSRVNQLVILVADDEPMIRNIARIVLEREGYFILTAGDGEEALLLSRAYPGTIHLFLTDVEMPKLDGFQLRERLREERPDTKELLMSGQVHLAGEKAFLPKPFGPDILKERVHHRGIAFILPRISPECGVGFADLGQRRHSAHFRWRWKLTMLPHHTSTPCLRIATVFEPSRKSVWSHF